MRSYQRSIAQYVFPRNTPSISLVIVIVHLPISFSSTSLALQLVKQPEKKGKYITQNTRIVHFTWDILYSVLTVVGSCAYTSGAMVEWQYNIRFDNSIAEPLQIIVELDLEEIAMAITRKLFFLWLLVLLFGVHAIYSRKCCNTLVTLFV